MTGTVAAFVAVLAAIGGVGGIVQLVKAIQSWRDGVRQREQDADERAIVRLERELDEMRIERRQDADHIRRLIQALGTAGIPIPPREATERERTEGPAPK